MRSVYAHAEGQSGLFAGIAPTLDKILFRTYPYRVPLLVGRIPKVEVVVVVAQGHEVAGTHALVEVDQFFGIPVLCFPVVAQVFESEGGRVAEMADVPVVGTRTLIVHEAGIPVAGLSMALRSPMCPDTELGVLEPFRAFPVGEGVPVGRISALLNFNVGGLCADGHPDCQQYSEQ